MLRTTADRLARKGEIRHPAKPAHNATDQQVAQYAVALAATWLAHLTDAAVDPIYTKLMGKTLTVKQLDTISRELLKFLLDHDLNFSPQDYASIYHHISQGLMKEKS